MGNQAEGRVLLDMFNQRNHVSCILEVFRTADSFFHPLDFKALHELLLKVPVLMNCDLLF